MTFHGPVTEARKAALIDCYAKAEAARNIHQSALTAYNTNPVRANKIALAAARRLLKETSALIEEWNV